MWHLWHQVVPGEDKTHSSGLILSNHDILMLNKCWNPSLTSQAECLRQSKKIFCENLWKSHENLPLLAHLQCSFLDNLCLYLYLFQNPTFSPFSRNISDIVAILPPRYCKSFVASACTLEGRIKQRQLNTGKTVKFSHEKVLRHS